MAFSLAWETNHEAHALAWYLDCFTGNLAHSTDHATSTMAHATSTMAHATSTSAIGTTLVHDIDLVIGISTCASNILICAIMSLLVSYLPYYLIILLNKMK
ncbi:hypothetical protein Lalb_Chr01g0015431 [Lupinus albus]|uniref:Uncharacterized protein n=1 Tax=Lupinus albus TaxID=3870 RepID=A0A6A4R5Z0_LUPAL|nr:hypothetical protein Lalb_Chr01g0015431 [Lupinus albus]